MQRKNFIKIFFISLIGGIIFLLYKFIFKTPEIVKLGHVNEFQYFPHYEFDVGEKEAILMQNDKGEFYTLNLECTHKKCKVEWNKTDKEFKCKCHHGRYNAKGEPIGGPPKRPLEILTTMVMNDSLVVFADKNLFKQ